jgi:hypothetical protein
MWCHSDHRRSLKCLGNNAVAIQCIRYSSCTKQTLNHVPLQFIAQCPPHPDALPVRLLLLLSTCPCPA